MLYTILIIVLAGLTAALGRWTWRERARRRAGVVRRGFVTIHPEWRTWLRDLRLIEAEDFVDLQCVIVSGHPGRQVGRLTLGQGEHAQVVYLKRETLIRWTTRLVNFLEGFGWVSRCVREAAILEALERDGLPGPNWLATGEDSQGRAFLLVQEVRGAVPLSTYLGTMEDPRLRRQALACLGEKLARQHDAGFFHRDLYAKHVLIDPEGQGVIFLDWQRAWRGAWTPYDCRVRDMAALHATLSDRIASPRDRLSFLHAYLRHTTWRKRSMNRRSLILQIQQQAQVMRQRRHIREKRQPPLNDRQMWICLDEAGCCITPELAALTRGRSLDWLRLDSPPPEPGMVSRRWIPLGPRRQMLLERRLERPSMRAVLRNWLLGRPITTPEQRMATLLWRLERHGVRTPRVLATGCRAHGGGYSDSFLLVEPHGGTIRLGTWLTHSLPPERREVLRQVGQILARMHDACCYFTQESLERLAVQPNGPDFKLVLESVEGIQATRRPRGDLAERDVSRVVLVLKEMGCDAGDLHAFFQGNAEYEAEDAAMMPSSPIERTQARPEPDLEGATPSLWKRLTQGWRRLHQRPDWASFAGPGWPDRIMDVAVTDQFHAKQGRSTGRWRLKAVDGSGRELVVYLKRHYVLPIWHGVLATLWPWRSWSPAMLEYDHLEWARHQGVPVPATVAAGEIIGPWCHFHSFLAVEELTNMLPLHEAVPLASRKLPPEVFRRWKQGLAAEMARLSRLLHDRRHFHKDLYLCHFFIHESDITSPPGLEVTSWRGRVVLIDLHRLTHHSWTWWLWQLKDLAQLLYSSEVEGIDARDQLAFWIHYRGPGAQRWSWRWMRRLILFKWRRYRRHNMRRKQRLAVQGGDSPT
ncbi:MAG: lipopolysaccharide kinase InaA family protein [Gemmataceae bacterium]